MRIIEFAKDKLKKNDEIADTNRAIEELQAKELGLNS